METVTLFAGSLPGSILMSLGQALVLVCVCFDMLRLLSVPGSHRRYLATTVFLALAWPSIGISAAVVLIHAAGGAWHNVAGGVFVLVAVLFRWQHGGDEDSWWKGKGKAVGRWLRKQAGAGSAAAPAAA